MLRLAHAWIIALALSCCCLSAAPVHAAGDPYIGIGHEVSDNPPGLKLSVVAGAPGDLAGLKTGDIITAIDGAAFSATPEVPFPQQLTAALKGRQVGDAVIFTVYRDAPELSLTRAGQPYATAFPLQELPDLVAQAAAGEEILFRAVRTPQTLDITVTLGARPDTTGAPLPPNASLACDVPDTHPGRAPAAGPVDRQARDPRGLRRPRGAAERRASADDGYRLARATYLLRDGLKGEAVTRQISDTLAGEASWGVDGYYDMQYYIAALLDLPQPKFGQADKPGHLSAAQHLDFLQGVLEQAAGTCARRFAPTPTRSARSSPRQREALTTDLRRGQLHPGRGRRSQACRGQPAPDRAGGEDSTTPS